MSEPRRISPPWGFLAALAACGWAAYHIRDVLAPFALGLAAAYLFTPLINFLAARGWRRDLAVSALYTVLGLAVAAAANSAIPTVSQELARLEQMAPVLFERAQEILLNLRRSLAALLPFGKSLVEAWTLKMYDPVIGQLPKLPGYILGLLPFLSLLFLVPFITFFLLMDSGRLLRHAVQLCPSRYVEQALHLISEIETSLGNYIRGLLVIVVAIGVASYAGLKAIGVDYAMAIAALSGVSSVIPYLGAILGSVIGALVAFLQHRDMTQPLQVLLLFGCIRLADEAFVQPLVSKHSIRLHPLIFLLAILAGGKVFGFIGLLFAVPAACVIKALARVAWDWYASTAQLPSPVSGAAVPYV